ncbi:MAG: LLM class flavin-dependent oxidoreductase [Leucobacter sp.]
MNKSIEVGVFLPTVKRAWFHSTNTLYTPGSFAHSLHVVRGAELFGYDFVLSPQNWRGTQGTSGYWRETVDSLAATGAFLQATDRVQVWGTAHITVFPPAVIAKMFASFDEIGPGRVGFNVVTGGQKTMMDTLGLWRDDLDHDQRYDFADEWIDVVKRLWAEESVDYDGEHFQLYDALLDPKPRTRPRLVNAGASSRGFRFAAQNCDVAFMVCGDDEKSIESARASKQIARDLGKPDFKTYGLMTIVPGETDAEAKDLMEWIEEGVDLAGLADLAGGYKANEKGFKDLSASSLATLGGESYRSVLPGVLIGSYESLARRVADVVVRGELDGIMVIVPDYINHLSQLALRTFPQMEQHGVTVKVGKGL